MIDFRALTDGERRLLAASRFADLHASQIPADWKQQIERTLTDHGVINEQDSDDFAGVEGSSDETN